MLLHFIFVVKEEDLQNRKHEFEYVKEMASFFQKWIRENFSETETAILSHGRIDIELENLEYELDKNETVEDINWDRVAEDHASDVYGYSEFDWDESDVEKVKSFDLYLGDFLHLEEVA